MFQQMSMKFVHNYYSQPCPLLGANQFIMYWYLFCLQVQRLMIIIFFQLLRSISFGGEVLLQPLFL